MYDRTRQASVHCRPLCDHYHFQKLHAVHSVMTVSSLTSRIVATTLLLLAFVPTG